MTRDTAVNVKHTRVHIHLVGLNMLSDFAVHAERLRLWRGSEECDNDCKELCQGCGDSVWWWSDGQRLQFGRNCLMWACEGGHFEILEYLCEVGGRELLMATDGVSGWD